MCGASQFVLVDKDGQLILNSCFIIYLEYCPASS